ncbi:FGGY family carbohydrate kinase [Streptomyces avidinii]|uniref:FGGY family carbohydrate kinase n=1 Tax=Streptomyces avidinii TaxID=1895 RepID=UPI00386856F3|nr:FGGY family carbohydrate kinase [Streptomyces avidinii]WTA95623.1 FGGY family carbohydrate kinase [Streptomyces avidinii]
MTGIVLAIDQGTSSTKALVVAADGTVLAEAEIPVPVYTPNPGTVEADPAALLASVLDAGRQAVAEAAVAVDVVALANQGESVLAWDPATGRPESACVVWQDRRAAEVCARGQANAARLTELTGLPLDPYFSAPKMRWLRDRLGSGGVITTTDTWLLHQLTGEFVTDAATASRSMLLDLSSATWSDEAWELFGLDEPRPRLVRNDEIVGTTRAFGREVPVGGVIVDQQAALWAQRCREWGEAKCTYGTGAFLLTNTGDRPVRSGAGLTPSVAWDLTGQRRWCLDGQVCTVGQALSWLRDVGLLDGPGDLDAVGETVDDTAGVVFVPSLAGLAAPHWQPSATGGFFGLNLAATRAHLVRAVCLGIAAQVVDLVDASTADLGGAPPLLRVDGGLTRSRLLVQMQADLLQAPVEVAAAPHATALGVADLGLRAATGHSLPDPRPGTIIEPSRSAEWAEQQLSRWRSALALSRHWSEL